LEGKTQHLKVKAILNNSSNEILFVRDVEKDLTQVIRLPEIIILYGETPEYALRRAIFELTNIEVEPLSLLGIYSKMELDTENTKHVITIVFVCLILDVGNVADRSNCIWLNNIKQTRMPLIEEDKKILRDYALWRIDKSTYWTSKLF
jgi:8-oxo-dGTP diphosphatase